MFKKVLKGLVICSFNFNLKLPHFTLNYFYNNVYVEFFTDGFSDCKPISSSVSEPFLNNIGKKEEDEEDKGPSYSVKELKAEMERKLFNRNHSTSNHELGESNFQRRPSFITMPRFVASFLDNAM